MRKAISWRVRGLVMARSYLRDDDRFVCQWCMGRLTEDQVVIDHFEPVARGGGNDPDNLCVSCARCNAVKSDMPPFEAEIHLNEIFEREAARNEH